MNGALSFIAAALCAFACQPATDIHGSLTPGIGISEPEFASAVVPARTAEGLCGTRPLVGELVISGGGPFSMHARTDDLACLPDPSIDCPGGLPSGRSDVFEIVPDPAPPDSFSCGLTEDEPRYRPITDNVIGTTANGFLWRFQLAFVRGCSDPPPGDFFGMPFNESTAFLVSVSPNCGESWVELPPIHAEDVGADLLGVGGFGRRAVDRQSLHVDVEQDILYLSFLLRQGVDGSGTASTIILQTSAEELSWRTIAELPVAIPTLLTSVVPCEACVNENPHDRPRTLIAFGCNAQLAAVVTVIEEPGAPPGTEGRAPVAVTLPGPLCQIAGNGVPGDRLTNAIASPDVAFTSAPTTTTASGVGPFGCYDRTRRSYPLRVVYPFLSAGLQRAAVRVHRVEIDRLVQPPSNPFLCNFLPAIATASRAVPVASRDLAGTTVTNAHVLWTDLVTTEGLTDNQSEGTVFKQVLRWTEVQDGASAVALDRFDTWQPLTGWDGAAGLDLHAITSSALFCRDANGQEVPYGDPSVDNCFFGDYKYGTFLEQLGGQPTRFFAGWNRTVPSAGRNAQIHGATLSF